MDIKNGASAPETKADGSKGNSFTFGIKDQPQPK
jgi:hypothetical protein